MIGRPCPIVGAETRSCKSTMRPGTWSVRGLIEMTGVGAVDGRYAASPISAWSFAFWRLVAVLSSGTRAIRFSIVIFFLLSSYGQAVEI